MEWLVAAMGFAAIVALLLALSLCRSACAADAAADEGTRRRRNERER